MRVQHSLRRKSWRDVTASLGDCHLKLPLHRADKRKRHFFTRNLNIHNHSPLALKTNTDLLVILSAGKVSLFLSFFFSSSYMILRMNFWGVGGWVGVMGVETVFASSALLADSFSHVFPLVIVGFFFSLRNIFIVPLIIFYTYSLAILI